MNKQSLFIKTALVAAVAFGVTACVTDTCNLSLAGVNGSVTIPQGSTTTSNVTGNFSTTTNGVSPTASCGTIGAILKGS